MGKNFFQVKDRETLENLFTDSKTKPIIIFKHSKTCGISSSIYREMEKLDDRVNLLEVHTARDLSREVADITGIRHETPQVIVLRDGKAVWNASHFSIKAEDVVKAVESHS